MAKEGLQLFGGDWTEQKLDALDQYLRAYVKVLSKQSYETHYIDAFAGTGYREQPPKPQHNEPALFFEGLEPLQQEEPQRFLDGSARLALKVEPPFDHYLFIELRAKKILELEKLKGEFPELAPRIDIQRKDANVSIKSICSTWRKARDRGVLFLDPFGMEVDWATLTAVAATKTIDVWILFPFAVNRLLTEKPQDIPSHWRNRLDKMFGTRAWHNRFYAEREIENIFDGSKTVVEKNLTLRGLGKFYFERLVKLFPAVAPNPRILTNTRGSPLFQLFFAAGNAGRGGEIALRIAKYILEHI